MKEEQEKCKSEVVIPALAMTKCENKVNRESQIEAIEAKLKLMEKKDIQDFVINKTVASEPSVVSLYQNKKHDTTNINNSGTSSTRHRYVSKRNDKRRTPYNKNCSRK